ncbi:MAG: LysR family transcriptional regulator [Rhodospirillales bacterium]|nr:LysR family transcriptional regulator [Rhodospirillales bacterium]
MPKMPSLHALRAFEAAARLGSFARAGQELHLTPSAISHQVRALEKHFGRSMFIRATRMVILTPEGERLLAALSQAFAIIHSACVELGPQTEKSDLSVHCTPSFAAKWLSPRLPGFLAKEPAINIRISTSAEYVDLRQHKDIDVVIAYGTAPVAAGITIRSFGEEEIVALCSPNYDAANCSVGAPDLERVNLLESTFSPVRWSDWFAANNLPFTNRIAGPAFDRGSLVVAAAVQGMGVALETLRFAQTEVDAGSLVRFGGSRLVGIKREMHYLCYRARDENDKNIQRFRDWALSEPDSDLAFRG